MSVLAVVSFLPAVTVFLASNSLPGPITFSAEPTATLTGSTSAHAAACAVPRTFHCVVADLPEVDEFAFGEVEQRRRQPVLGHRLGADVLGLHRTEPGGGRVLHGKAGVRLDGGAVPEEGDQRRRRRDSAERPTPTPPSELPRTRSQSIGPRQADRAPGSARRHPPAG